MLLLVFFGTLYVADTSLYLRILVWVTKKPFPHPFIDWEWIPSAVKCWQRGVDVYADNTCYDPVVNGRHNYSPLWLRMTFLPYEGFWIIPFGVSFAVFFFSMLASLPLPRGANALCVTFLATFSSLTVFAIERANVDLIMFLLAMAGVHCWLGTLRFRLAGYGIFLLAGLLKFYPFVLLALALRERPRAFTGVCAVTLAVLATFGWVFHDELVRVGANIPNGSPFGDMFGAEALPYGLAMFGVAFANDPGEPNPSAIGSALQNQAGHISLLLMTLMAIGCAIKIERRFRLAEALTAMPRREAGFLVAGAALICGCFFAGQNIGYRAIMILPTLPGLLWLARSLPMRAGRILFTTTGWAIVFVMWVLAVQQIIATYLGPFGPTAFLHWLLNQLVWWVVVTVLLAVLLSFALESEMGRLTMHRLRPRSAKPSTADQIALDITPVLSRSPDRTQMGTKSGRDATQETDHEIRHLL